MNIIDTIRNIFLPKPRGRGVVPSTPDARDWHYSKTHGPIDKQGLTAVGAFWTFPWWPAPTPKPPVVVSPPPPPPVVPVPVPLPGVSLRSTITWPVPNQNYLNSCVAFASEAAYRQANGGGPYSRLQLYYDTRALEGNVNNNYGVQMRNGLKVWTTNGGGLESMWQYVPSNFKKPPPAPEEVNAKTHLASSYSRLLTHDDFHACLDAGHPFIIAIQTFPSFEHPPKTGLVPMPSANEVSNGGHALLVIGYTVINGVNYYEVLNSWGTTWGQGGFGYLPANYVEGPLCYEAWTLR